MQDKAEATGLRLRSKEEPGAHDCLAEVNDSFKEFMFGAYSVLKKRFWRPFGTGLQRIGPREHMAALEGEARIPPGLAAPAPGQARLSPRRISRCRGGGRGPASSWPRPLRP